jgi:aspartyl-tRNA(Asn)/glutamyl-tRNA(Gln) amidotransferase subunit C
MKVTEKDVADVADLANLELGEGERGLLLRDLNSILDYVDCLNQLDTTDVPQMSDSYGVSQSKTVSGRSISSSREDVLEGLRKSLPHDVALQNATDSDGTFFKVPKVIER